MKKARVFKYLSIIYIVSLILLVQVSCTNKTNEETSTSKNITLYIFESDDNQTKLNVELFVKQKPVLILDSNAVRKVRLIQSIKDKFTLEIQLSEYISNELGRITSANIGKKLVFVSDSRILFAAVIFEAIQEGRVVVELSSIKKAEAENIAGYFSSSFEFIDNC